MVGPLNGITDNVINGLMGSELSQLTNNSFILNVHLSSFTYCYQLVIVIKFVWPKVILLYSVLHIISQLELNVKNIPDYGQTSCCGGEGLRKVFLGGGRSLNLFENVSLQLSNPILSCFKSYLD
jgi:hypothetical protein